MRRRFVSFMGMTVFVLSFGAAPAYADNELGLSRDGTNWSQSLTKPLFDSNVIWVPGDIRMATFWVRNQGPTGSEVILDVVGKDKIAGAASIAGAGASIASLLKDGDIHLAAMSGVGPMSDDYPWVDLDVGSPDRLSTSAIPVGDKAWVKVRATYDAAATAQAKFRDLGFSFSVTIQPFQGLGGGQSDGTGPPGAQPPGAQEIAGFLPGTGAPKVMWIAAIGAILVGVGISLVEGRRREEEGEYV